MKGDLGVRITYIKREPHSPPNVVGNLFAINLCYFISDTCQTSQRTDGHKIFMNETYNITVLMLPVLPNFRKFKS
jgi:hypothetical protein